MLAKSTLAQIEDEIGRPRSVEEVAEVGQLAQLTETHLSVGRILAKRKLVTCIKYLRGVVNGLDTQAAGDFMDAVLNFGESVPSWSERRQRGDE